MSGTITYTLKFDSNGNAVLGGITDAATKVQKSISKTQQVCDKFGASFLKLEMAKRAIEGVGQGFKNIMGPGMEVQSSMADLSAITGLTGEKLNEIEGYARKAAKTFGGSAAQSIESYKLILSQLGPEIAKTPAALKAMGESVATLSKTMGGDSVAATEVLTTAMNQFQVSLDDPIEASKVMADMMNTMAAAAKAGSAELPAIQKALQQSGMAAKMAGLSFGETNAAIQVLDKAGKKGAEGGVALRNVLAQMGKGRFIEKSVQENLLAAGIDVEKLGDKSLTLSDRLNMLKPVLNDSALLSKMFGLENANAAMALISGTGLMDEYTQSIQGTNTAYDQASVIMETAAEKMARMKARVDDMKIGIFNLTGAAYPYIDVMMQSMTLVSDMVPAMMLLQKAFMFVTNAQKMKALWDGILAVKTAIVTGATWLLNAALAANPIVLIIGLIAGLVAGFILAYNKIGWFRGAVLAAWEAIKGFGIMLKDYVIDRIKGLLSGIAGIGGALVKLFKGDFAGAWNQAKEAVGDLIGVDAAKKAVDNAKKVGQKVGSAYLDGVNQVEARKQKAGLENAGIAEPHLPGVAGLTFQTPTTEPAGQTTEAIATGGTRNTTVNITIGKSLVDTINIAKAGFTESVDEMTDKVLDQLSRVFALAQANANL
ncbi:MAG: phage tail tape measure protein [Bacteroidales bacterium]